MAVVARARSKSELSHVTDSVHDRWFDLSTLRFDEPNGRVTLELMEEADYLRAVKGEEASPSLRLVISNASRLRIEDSEQVGYYDLSQLVADEEAGVLKLVTGVPLTAEALVSAVDVLVESLLA